jgi:hypothetical protein
MKIPCMKPLTNCRGTVIVDAQDEKPMELRTVVQNSLYYQAEGDAPLTVKEIQKRHDLARAFNDEEVDLSPEDLTFVRELVAKTYPATLAGPALDALG